MSIRQWPAAERPREKLLQRGPAALSDAELLAIFLRTGVSGCSAVDLARELLQEYGGLRPLLDASETRFCRSRGLGRAKYCQMQAVLEMSRRHLQEALQRGVTIDSARMCAEFVQLRLRGKKREHFLCLFLDSQHQLIACESLFQGTIDGAAVYPREVLRRALELQAAALIFAHNHPSGISEPSQADRDITARLKRALALVDIPVLDHLIVGDTEVCSMAELGLV